MKSVLRTAAAAIMMFSLSGPLRAAPVEVPQDVVFLFDSSGSLGAAGYQAEIAFMKSIVQTYGSDADHPINFGFIEFSRGAIQRWNLYNQQDPIIISSFLDSLTWLQGTTHTRSAVIAGIDHLVTFSDFSRPRTLVLITDGLPVPADTQDPCGLKPTIDGNGIEMHVVGSGTGFDPTSLSCLVDDPTTQISLLTEFDIASTIDFQQGFIDGGGTTVAARAPGALAIFGTALLAMGAMRRRAC